MDFNGILNSLKHALKLLDTTSSFDTSALKSKNEQPPQELVHEFERLLEQDPIEQTQESNTIQQNATIEQNNTIYLAEEPPKTSTQLNITVKPSEYAQEIQNIFKSIENNTLSSSELYRLQYLVNILNVQINQQNSLSQSSTNQIETILKQKG